MRQILLKDTDIKLTINLEANVVIEGSYTRADYNTPEDYRISQLENIVNKLLPNDININPNKFITNNKIISSYEDVIEHFKKSDDKYFVTGITDSKQTIITKYFNKNNFIKTDKVRKNIILIGDDNNKPIELEPDLTDNHILRTKFKLDIPGLDIYGMILSENQNGLIEYVLYLETKNPIKYIDLGNGLSRFIYMRSHDDEQDVSPNIILYNSLIDEPKIISEVFIDRGLNSAFERIKKLKNTKNINELAKMGLGYYKINTKGFNFNT